MLNKTALQGLGRRALTSILAFLMIISVLPAMWSAAAADEYDCGLTEHTHSADCSKLICSREEGEQYGAHYHDETCREDKLICGIEESDEHRHTDECSSSEIVCILDEGDNVLLGVHTHSDECYARVCGFNEHVHTDECKKSDEAENTDDAENESNDMQKLAANSAPMLLAGASSALSVSGIWDYGTGTENENIAFDSDDVAVIEHSNTFESETVDVRISAVFPEGAVDKKLKITLKEGLVWFINGAGNLPASTLKSVSSLQNQSKIYGENLGNGSYVYEFADGVENVDIEIMVKKTILTNFPEIADAIVAEASCIYGGALATESTSLKKLQPEQVEIGTVANNKYSAYVKPDEPVFAVGSPFVIHTYTPATKIYHKRLYDYVEFTLEAPADIELVTAANDHRGQSISNISTPGWELKSREVNGDIATYVFRLDDLSTSSAGITPEWNIPSANYSADDVVVVKAKKVEWKLYGDDTVYFRNGTGTLTYNVVDPNKRNEIVLSKAYNHAVQLRADSPDAVYQLTGWALRNDGADPSAPKIVDFEFDTEKIGVTGVTLLVPAGEKITTVWYKLVGDTEWRSKTVNLTGPKGLGNILVTNVLLGLNEDDHFAAFRYELDFNNNNGTPSDPSDDFRYGIPAGAVSAGYSGVHVPIAGVNLGLSKSGDSAVSYVRIYDKTGEGEEILADTGKVAIKANYSTSAYNYLSTSNAAKIQASAGTTIHLSTKLSATYSGSTSFSYCVGFTHYPVLYIRDETGEGISNVKLVNSDGVDILSKYSDYVSVVQTHTETEDFNGDGKLAKVYRIDTSPLSELPLREDRYAAAVGFFGVDGKKNELTLSYTITHPSTYNDSQVLHYMHDAIMISDASVTSSTNRNTAMQFTDPYDVNADGKTDGIAVLKPNPANQKGYYIVLSRADISVSAAVKRASDTQYVKWDGSEDYFQVEPNADFNVDFGVFNGSGNTTSTDPDKITYIYIPVPKKGDEWGLLNSGVDENGNDISEFAFTAKLTEAVSNPNDDVFDIEYAVIDTSAFSKTTDIAVVGTTIRNGAISWGAYSADANCIRIALKGMPSSDEAEDFVLPLAVDHSVAKGETNIYYALYFEDITDDQNRRYTGWFKSDGVAVQITWGEINGRVWKDLNGNGRQDEGEPGIGDKTVELINTEAADKKYSAVTDAQGNYRFPSIPLGNYKLRIEYITEDYAISPKDEGSSDRIDSDAAADGAYACISDIVIPFSDGMGKLNYAYENADFGLTPKITVSYSWSGDCPADATLPEPDRLAAGTNYNAEAVPDVTGYTFSGWYTDEECTLLYTDGAALVENTVLYGKWQINQYTVSFDTKGGTEIDDITLDYGSDITAPADPTKTGYTFTGWDKAIPSTMPAEDTLITAKWQVNQYTVSFDTKGGTAIDDITLDYGSNITAPADPTKTGYTFMGWDKAIPSTMPAEDTLITANWQINQYTVSFDTKGGTAIADITLDYGSDITAPADPTKTGYTFTGWDKAIPTTMPAENMVITAGWQINRYDVTYEKGSNAPSAAVLPQKETVDYNTSYNTVRPDAINGYKFAGWYTDAACAVPFEEGFNITQDTVIYGKWTRNTVDINGSVTWVENGEGFTRPESVTVNLLQNGNKIDSVVIAKNEAAGNQPFSFSGVYQYNEAGTEQYTYTVEQETTPANYVETQSGYEIVNTYNVNKYHIAVEWDHTGAPADKKITESQIVLYRDDTGYRTANLTEAVPNAVTTVPRTEADGHTFRIEQQPMEGYSTTYGEPEGRDTDNDGAVDTIFYTVKNTYIMPKVTVSGEIEWLDVPAGETVPDITVKLMLNGEVIDSVDVPGGNISYQFTELDRYNADGSVREYTVEADAVPSYAADYSAAQTDAEGNIIINITEKGEFEYGSVTVSNTVIGGYDEFTFTVTVGKNVGLRRELVQYPYTGTYSGLITAGEPMTITLRDGEYITVSDLLVGAGYVVEQQAHPDYYTTPAELYAAGVISAAESRADFVNSKIPTGVLSIATKVTGSAADKSTVFDYEITFDSDETYDYSIGDVSGTLKSGDVISLSHGQSAVIYGIKENTAYEVKQVEDHGYSLSVTGASGKMTPQGGTASFINTKNSRVAAGSDVPKTGDYGMSAGEITAIYVMQGAMLMMLFCVWRMNRRRKEN